MENINFSKDTSKGLGIACLVLGIITVLFSFIPCLGVYAIYPGIIAILLSVITIFHAIKYKLHKDLAIAGLVCSIIGTCVATWQWYKFKKKTSEIKERIENIGKVKQY